jgi:hypothetical protein
MRTKPMSNMIHCGVSRWVSSRCGTSRRCAARRRRGSALLICTLAIAVISLASVAIVRSNQRGIANIDGIRASRQARHNADGLIQRSIATIRVAPTTVGTLPLPTMFPPDARVELTRLSPSATQIHVFLYDPSTIPARALVVDPSALSGSATPPVAPTVPVTPVTPTAPGKPSKPKGKPASPPGKPASPPGKPASPPGKPASPPGKPASPGKSAAAKGAIVSAAK